MKQLLILFLVGCSHIFYAQDIALAVHTDKEKMIFRWAPENVEIFRQGLENGYLLERISENGDVVKIDTIRAYSDDKTRAIISMHPEDDAATIAAYYLYGEDKEEETKGFSDMFEGFDYKYDEELNYHLVLSSADLSARAAIILGLRYEINGYDSSKKCVYRLRCLGDSLVAPAGYYFTGELSYYPQIESTTYKQQGDILELKWDNIYYQQFYTAYDVFRAESPSGPFLRRNTAPIYMADANAESVFFNDTVIVRKRYYYKLQGHTAYDLLGPLSDVIEVNVRDPYIPFSISEFKARGNHNSIKVEWKATCDDPSLIKNVVLLKSSQDQGPYQEISDVPVSSASQDYIDRNINDQRSHYYKIAAQNAYGYWYSSTSIRAVYIDEVAPSTPVDLKAVIDSSGVCYIHWKPNEENDLKGYRVYKSNREKGTFYHAHDLLNMTNTFTDTVGVKYLCEELYYKVVAVDYDNNHSAYSATIKVSRPDVLPPVPAQIYDYEVATTGVKLYIHNSPSKDVVRSFVVKAVAGSDDYNETEISPDQNSFLDSEYKSGQTVDYYIRTVDDAQNSAKGATVSVRSRKITSSITRFNAFFDEPKISLSWKVEEDCKILFYLQDQSNMSFQFFAKVDGNKRGYDSPWGSKGQYKVAAILQRENGKQDPPVFSDTIIID